MRDPGLCITSQLQLCKFALNVETTLELCFSAACSITDYDTDSVIIIGGSGEGGMSGQPTLASSHSNTTVVRYNLDGLLEVLPSTNKPRVGSACGSYKANGEQVRREERGDTE